MDTKALVNNLKSMSNKIIADKKTVSLIMLLGNDDEEHTTGFDYVISANWLNDYDQDKGMDIVLDYLFNYLSVEDREHINRVTIIHTSDPIVQSIAGSMNIRNTDVNVTNSQFGNIIIPYAIIFEASIEQ